jgi:hypothetical protein
MKTLIIVSLLCILGCNKPTQVTQDLYIDNVLVVRNATVEQFCKVVGNSARLVRNYPTHKKDLFSKSEQK